MMMSFCDVVTCPTHRKECGRSVYTFFVIGRSKVVRIAVPLYLFIFFYYFFDEVL